MEASYYNIAAYWYPGRHTKESNRAHRDTKALPRNEVNFKGV